MWDCCRPLSHWERGRELPRGEGFIRGGTNHILSEKYRLNSHQIVATLNELIFNDPKANMLTYLTVQVKASWVN